MTKDERPRLHALLKRHGWNASSFQTLASDFQYWFEGQDACVAYVDTGRAWIAAGAPVAPIERMAEVAAAFVAAAAAQGRRAGFFGTETRFTALVPYQAVPIGEQPIWDPHDWDEVLRSSASLREQLRRARAKGVTVRELGAGELSAPGYATRQALDGLVARWIESRRLPPMRFVVQMEPFTFLGDKHCWIAEQHGVAVGLLVAAPIYDRQGWLFENLLRDRRTPNGTTELLIDHAMRAVREGGSTYVTLGLVPLSGPVGTLLRLARFLGRGLYDFEGLQKFKAKLRPGAWTPIFLSVPASQGRASGIYDVLNAFAGRSLLEFGWLTLARGWAKAQPDGAPVQPPSTQ